MDNHYFIIKYNKVNEGTNKQIGPIGEMAIYKTIIWLKINHKF